MELGQYFQYRERDVGRGYVSQPRGYDDRISVRLTSIPQIAELTDAFLHGPQSYGRRGLFDS
jgi:hypothetical protein